MHWEQWIHWNDGNDFRICEPFSDGVFIELLQLLDRNTKVGTTG